MKLLTGAVVQLGLFVAVLLWCLGSLPAAADYDNSRTAFTALPFEERVLLQWRLVWTGHYIALADGEFGRRTYDALRRFQVDHGYTATGVLTDSQEQLLVALSGAIIQSVGFTMMDDRRSNQRLGVPSLLAPIREETRRGTRWRSEDEAFVIETTEIPYYEVTYEELFDRLSSAGARRSITYKVDRGGFFVVRGTQAGKPFHIRMRRAERSTRGVTISWRSSLGEDMEGIVLALAEFVFDLETVVAEDPPASDNSRQVLVVASRPTLTEAIDLARLYAADFEHTSVYRASNGRYAISIGWIDATIANGLRLALIADGMIPPDSFLSAGTWLDGEVWSAAGQQAASGDTGPSDEPAEEFSIGSATGFFVTDDGAMLTNAHVAGDCSTIQVPAHGEAALLRKDDANDLAVVKVDADEATPHAVFQEAPLRPGSDVVVLGYPLADLLGSTLTTTSGHVSSLSGMQGDTRYFQMSAPIQPGSSGGPVFDMTGRVVGVATARINDLAVVKSSGALPQNVNFALRYETVSAFLRSAGVEYASERSVEMRERADVSEAGAKFTAQVLCLP